MLQYEGFWCDLDHYQGSPFAIVIYVSDYGQVCTAFSYTRLDHLSLSPRASSYLSEIAVRSGDSIPRQLTESYGQLLSNDQYRYTTPRMPPSLSIIINTHIFSAAPNVFLPSLTGHHLKGIARTSGIQRKFHIVTDVFFRTTSH